MIPIIIKKPELKKFYQRGKKPKEERRFYYNMMKILGYSTTQAMRIRDWRVSKINLLIKNTMKKGAPLIGI